MIELTKFRTLTVDDEKFVRADLKELLSQFPIIEVIGEAKNINLAIDAIDKLNPDLIFLDIQFPGEAGFSLFDRTNVKAKVIFVTAYDEFAIRAFDVNACDYLLKPVNPERLAIAINRLQNNFNPSIPKNITLKNEDSLYLGMNYKYYFVRVDSIIKINSFDHYTEIITSKGLKGLTNKHLWEWEETLPKETFIQIHRSIIINMNFVVKIERGNNYSYSVFMKNIDAPIPISRRFASKIKNRIKIL